MPNELYDLAKNLVVIDMMKKDPGNLFKYLTIQYRITACQFELLRQLILGPTTFNCLVGPLDKTFVRAISRVHPHHTQIHIVLFQDKVQIWQNPVW